MQSKRYASRKYKTADRAVFFVIDASPLPSHLLKDYARVKTSLRRKGQSFPSPPLVPTVIYRWRVANASPSVRASSSLSCPKVSPGRSPERALSNSFCLPQDFPLSRNSFPDDSLYCPRASRTAIPGPPPTPFTCSSISRCERTPFHLGIDLVV